MQVKIFKLISGEEIIAKIDTPSFTLCEKGSIDFIDIIKLHNPMQLVTIPSENGPSVALVPWMITVEEEDGISVFAKNLLCPPLKPDKEIENQYRMTTSDIVAVSSKLEL